MKITILECDTDFLLVSWSSRLRAYLLDPMGNLVESDNGDFWMEKVGCY